MAAREVEAELEVDDGVGGERSLSITDFQNGTDGTSPPTLPGGSTGVRGWLRLVYNTITAQTGAAGDSAPSLATNASGLIGWLRKLVDILSSRLPATLNADGGLPVHLANTSPLSVQTTPAAYAVLTRNETGDPLTWTEGDDTYTATYTASGDLDTITKA